MFAVVESRVSGAKGSDNPETWSGAHKSRLVLGPACRHPSPPHNPHKQQLRTLHILATDILLALTKPLMLVLSSAGVGRIQEKSSL